MNHSVLFSSATDQWTTPKHIYDSLNAEFMFNFDPCPFNGNTTFDGLSIEWGESNFVNPPYSKIKEWCRKAWEEAQKDKTVVMLIPSRTDTKYWHDYVMKADEIRFIKGRLKFGDAKHNAPFPSCIVIYNRRPK